MRPILAIALAAMPTFLSGLEQSIMSTAAATIARQMGSEAELAWILAAFFIAASVATPIYGRLSDHFGPMRVLIFAILTFAGGSVLATQAGSFHVLVIARFIQGIGGGGLISLPQAFLSQTIAPRERAAYQGYLVAVAFAANTFGPLVGGILIDSYGWQSIFVLQVPLAVIAACLLGYTPKKAVESSASIKIRFDWLGALFLMLAVASLLMLTQTLSRNTSTSTADIWAAIFAIALASLILVEFKVADPLLPLSLLRGPIVWRCGVIVFLYGFLFTGLSSYVPLLLRKYYELSPKEIGLMMMPLLGAVGVGSIITGQMVRRSGYTMVFPTIGLIAVAAILSAFTLALKHLTAWETALWMGINGLFMGSTLGVVQVAVQIGAPAGMIGRATAFVQLSRTIGASLGAGLGGLIYFRAEQLVNQGGPAAVTAAERGQVVHVSQFSTLPFVLLFCFFAAVALIAALTARSCRVPKIT
ncbi:MFS family permease [Neorhizobium galegae]|uniref:MFS transporter n=1 Tax=Neorhizobium galegae TaxID=399 RepID=UPI0027832EF8|nr:MFS transporter [Neorhizobium galegae]MDQ0137787.1 MFS family permease [Neorhizobium galegae]